MSAVLVVDDDASVRRLLKAVLTVEGHDVTLADGGREALESVKKTLPDLIVLDLMMPDLDGRAVFRCLESLGRRPPVLILSAHEGDKARRELGAEASLSKPFDPDDLVEAVEKLST